MEQFCQWLGIQVWAGWTLLGVALVWLFCGWVAFRVREERNVYPDDTRWGLRVRRFYRFRYCLFGGARELAGALMSPGTKKCPACRNIVIRTANVCEYCHSSLPA
jgi:hypothetical protein